MLAARAAGQLSRVPGFQPMARKPPGHVGDWDPAWQFKQPGRTAIIPACHLGEWDPAGRRQPGRTSIIPAWMNRRTGKPHEHKREIARRTA